MDERESEVDNLQDQICRLNQLIADERRLRLAAEHKCFTLESRLAVVNPTVRAFGKGSEVWKNTFAISREEWTRLSSVQKDHVVHTWADATKSELNYQMEQDGNVSGKA